MLTLMASDKSKFANIKNMLHWNTSENGKLTVLFFFYYNTSDSVCFTLDLHTQVNVLVLAQITETTFEASNTKHYTINVVKPIVSIAPNWVQRWSCLLSAVQVHTTTHCRFLSGTAMYPSPKASTELMNIFIIYPVSRCFYLLVMNE